MTAELPTSNAGVDAETDINASQAPLIEHLTELRTRLIWSIVAMAIGFGICFYFAQPIYTFLMDPLVQAMENSEQRRMIYTALQEAFFSYIKIGLFGAFFLAFPIIASQVWMFVAPGLYKHEKKAFLPFLVVTPFLFLAGAAMAYYVVFPLAFSFFLGFETEMGEMLGAGEQIPIQFEGKVNEYLSLTMRIIMAFGICFELPVMMSLLARVGMVTSKGLSTKRKYAIVVVFIVAAIITPPDLVSQLLLAAPLMILYEISIVCVRMIEKSRAKREAEEYPQYADDEDETEK